jgi:hypothetical protein
MSKKIMLLALAVAALFALPAGASAQELHWTVPTGSSLSGSGGAGTLTTTGEPQIKCTSNTASGKFDTGSTTTGTVTLDFIGCTAEFFGIKVNCNTSGAASGTIANSGTFHLVTLPGEKPGIFVTGIHVTIICAGFSNSTVKGTVIGTITSPACSGESNTLNLSFESKNTATQEHLADNTGTKAALTSETAGSGKAVASGLTGSGTVTSASKGKLDCT